MKTHLEKPRTNAEFHLERMLEGSRIGDMLIYTKPITQSAGQVPCALCIRNPHMGGGQYLKTYEAIIQFQDLMRGKPLAHKRAAPQAQIGKAIIVDSDSNDYTLIVEGTSDRWIVQSHQVVSGFGVPVGFYKADLSADENKAFSLLLGAMQKEQPIANRVYTRVMAEHADTEQLVEHDDYAAGMWQRLTDMQQQLSNLTARAKS